MAYSIERDNNNFKIVTDNFLSVILSVQTSCDLSLWENVGLEQSGTSEINITLPVLDNVYKISINNQSEIEEIIIYKFDNFITSFVDEIKEIVCNCGSCNECEDCDKKDYSSILLKLISYNILNNNIYTPYFLATNDCIKCEIFDINMCILLNETVKGNADNSHLMKKIIMYFYLIFYYVDLKLNKYNVTELYQYKKMISCFKKIGINDTCIKNAILDGSENDFSIYNNNFNNTFA